METVKVSLLLGLLVQMQVVIKPSPYQVIPPLMSSPDPLQQLSLPWHLGSISVFLSKSVTKSVLSVGWVRPKFEVKTRLCNKPLA